jgi:branched-chain amino acid transport system ATP-binding protein
MSLALQIERVSKSFGGLMAVHDVTLEVEEGTVMGLIGPNGAGKTTLFNVITGFHRPSSGRIAAHGEEISGLSPDAICRRGICRTFQLLEVFPTMTVFDNVAVGVLASQRRTFQVLGTIGETSRRRVNQILEMTRLQDRAEVPVAQLGLPERKKVELAVALAANPRILLLDEPVAGMAVGEKPALIELIRTIQEQTGVTTVLIEHDVDVIWGIADQVAVLHYGQIIAQGTPQQIRADERVRDVYLGQERHA